MVCWHTILLVYIVPSDFTICNFNHLKKNKMAKQTYFNPRRKDAFFDKVLMEVPSTNLFNLSHNNKLSFNMGDLVPVYVQEVYPGDKFKVSEEHLMKMAPLAVPTFHRCNVDLHAFFIPYRLLWDGFEDYQAYDTLNEIAPHPFIDTGSPLNSDNDNKIKIGSLADYMGIPTTESNLSTYSVEHPLRNLNPLFLSAYIKTWNDYFRDQNLQDEIPYELKEGLNIYSKTDPDANLGLNPFEKGSLLRRAWERDYFTSCLPFAQKGMEVVLPLGTTAPLIYDAVGETVLRDQNGDILDIVDPTGQLYWDTTTNRIHVDDLGGADPEAHVDNSENLLVDLTNATSASVNDLRLSIRMQEFYERNARLGTRYIEQMLGKFGVRISDSRAHRAEFIGSTRSAISFSEVLQTSQTDTTPLAQQAGHGLNVNTGFLFNHFVEEHGCYIVLASVLPETSYSQGLHKMWYKKDILDYYDPMFQNLGEQAVKSWELYADDNSTYDVDFGYQSRYAEMKYNLDRVSGQFRGTLSDWHMSRIFSSPPTLQENFVSSNPTHRIFADTDEENDKLYAWFRFDVQAQRKIAFYSDPKLSAI